MDEKTLLATKAKEKVLRANTLVKASLDEFQPFDSNKSYTAKELEPYDALSDRFIRAVECALKFFRSYEMWHFAEHSETTRDLLNRMHKVGLVSSVGLWIEMRDVRNRIVHDYLPEQLVKLYADLSGRFGAELVRLTTEVEALTMNDDADVKATGGARGQDHGPL